MGKKSCFLDFYEYTTFTSIEEDNTLTVITILFWYYLFIILSLWNVSQKYESLTMTLQLLN